MGGKDEREGRGWEMEGVRGEGLENGREGWV